MSSTVSRRCVLTSMLAFVAIPALSQTGGGATAAQANTKAMVLNRCTRISSMSQRIVKLKALQLLQISPDSTSDSILATEKLLTSHLSFLSSSVAAALKPNVDTLDTQIRALLTLVAIAPSKTSLLASAKAATETLQQSERLAVELQKGLQVQSALALDIAGKQRMLLQRMAKNYFLIAAGVEPPTGGAAIDSDRKFFTDGLQVLTNSPDANSMVKQKLTEMTGIYRKYDAMLVDRSEKAFSKNNLSTVHVLSEQLLTGSHEIAMIFEGLVKA
jgi:Type IV pili methyl-accepting chemotaxis transducer N-term